MENESKKIIKINSEYEEPVASSLHFNVEKENEWQDIKHLFDELLANKFIDSNVWYKCIILARLNLDLPIISKGIISVNIT